MNPHPDDGSIRSAEDRLRAEHAVLESLIRRVLATTEPATLEGELRELHGAMHRHFASEEYPGGFYERMGAIDPSWQDEIREMVDEHFEFISRVQELIEAAREADRARDDLLGAVRDLAERMRAHEAREQRMAREAVRLQEP